MRRIALVAAVLAAACSSDGNAPPGGSTMGAVRFVWTIDGQAAATACPAGGQVTIESTTGPTPVNRNVACGAGTVFVMDLVPGFYRFRATLSGGTAPIIVDAIELTVVADMTLDSQVPFMTGASQSTLQVRWTINGGMHCPSGAMVTAGVLSGATIAGLQMAPCGDYQATVTGLVPGTYTARVLVDNGTMQAMGEQANVMVQAGANMVGPIDVTCSFCP